LASWLSHSAVGWEWAVGCDEKDISTVVDHAKWRKEDYFTSLTITFQPNKEGLSGDKPSFRLYGSNRFFEVVLQTMNLPKNIKVKLIPSPGGIS
jgi:hypothetical protein